MSKIKGNNYEQFKQNFLEINGLNSGTGYDEATQEGFITSGYIHELESKLKESETENAELKKVLFYSQQFVSNANEYMRGKMDELNVEIEKEKSE